MTLEKKKMGRPPKDTKGKMIWIPSEYVDAIQTFLDVLKNYKPNKQATQ